MTNSEAALDLARRGVRVIPILPRTKRPAFRAWQRYATDDETKVAAWWERNPDHGVGIATGPETGIWVLDVDGQQGLERLRELVDEHGPLPKGPRVDTGTGGFHLYFNQPADIRVGTTKNIVGSGLDARGNGGQVLAPPTGHAWDDCKLCADPDVECPGLDYRWHEGRDTSVDLPDAPDWLLAIVVPADSADVSPSPAPMPGPAEGDTLSPAAEMARQYRWHDVLANDGWTLVGHRGNDTEWRRPGKTGDGISAVLHEPDGPFVNFSTNADDLCQGWAATVGSDGWSYSMFGYLAATRHDGDRSDCARQWRLERNRSLDLLWESGMSGPRAAPDSTDGHGDTSLDLSWAHLVEWPAFWKQDHSAEQWVVWPLIPEGRAVALYAPAKAGKSSVVLAAVAAAAAGYPIFGVWNTPPVDVLYLDFEMTEKDLWERLADLGFGPDTDLSRLHYALLPSMYPFDTERGGMQILYLAKAVGAQVVIIDTYGRAVEGPENDADTTRDFERHTGRILKAEGIAVLRTDHAGKDKDQGQRGSSGKNDDVDVVWSLERTGEGARITRTHSRINWVPERVEIDYIEHDDGLVVYRLAQRRQWDAGIKELAETLAELEVPLDAGYREAGRLLRNAGGSASSAKLRQAQAYREAQGLDDWVVDIPPDTTPEPGLL